MAKPIAGLLAEIKQKAETVSGLFAKADENGGAMSDAEITQVKDLNKEIEALDIKARDAMLLEEIRGNTAERVKARESGTAAPEQRTGNRLSDQVFADEQFKSWRDNAMRNGAISDNVKMDSPRAQVKTLITGDSSTSAGAFVTTERTSIVDMGTFARPLTIRDLVTSGTTSSDVVDFVRQTAFTNAAAVVAEATSSADGAKPESALAWEVVAENVKTIAHWIPITRRGLADVGQMRMYIDQWLRYGLEEALESQMISGAGGANFTGILNTPNIQSQAWTTNILTTTRKARTKVVVTGRATPTAYVLHPNDWETIDLLQDNEARYYFGGPSALGNPRLWGLPVVESEAITEGTGLVADWRMAALWDREQAQIFVTDSHSDFFIRNILVLLAELRAAFGVIRPKAFVQIDLTA
jgi:HK97 family phage major capsid protein